MANVATNTNSENMKAIVKIALSATMYGFLGCFGAKLLEQQLPLATMLFWRFFIASLWMLPSTLKQRQLFQAEKKPLLLLVFVLGSLCYCGSSAFYFMASQLTGTGPAMVIFFAYPIFVIIFAWLLERRRISPGMLITVISISLGLFLLKGNADSHINLFGIFLALLAGFCYSLYVYGSQHSVRSLPSNQLTLLICFGCSTVFLIYSLLTHSFAMPSSLQTWLYIAGIGIVATAIPIQLMLDGLQVIHSSKASILTVLEPLVTVFIGILWLNESLSSVQIIGALIVLISAVVIQFERQS